MADYAKVAMEEKARHDAAGFAATEELKQKEASGVFFADLEAALIRELNKANPELEKHGLLKGHKAGGIMMPPKRFATQIRLSYGRNAACEVNFDQSQSMIQLEMNADAEMRGDAVHEKAVFRIRNSDAGAAARKVELEQETAGELGPGDIAEIVIVGLIRGHFE